MLKLGLYEDLKAGLLDRAEYDTLKDELSERISDAEASVELLNSERRELVEGVTSQQSWIEQFRQYENISELSRKMIMHLVERINVFEGSSIEIVFRHRDQIEEIMAYLEEKDRQYKIISLPRLEVV